MHPQKFRHLNCNLCGSPSTKVALSLRDAHDAPTKVMYCSACASLTPDYRYVWSSVDNTDLQVQFHDSWWSAVSDEELVNLRDDLLKMLSDFPELKSTSERGGKTFVEIGSGRGGLLAAAKDLGFNVLGCEPSEFLFTRSKAFYKLSDQELVKAEAKEFIASIIRSEEKADAIFLWHVLEHVEDPLVLLRQCSLILRGEGMIYLQLPMLRKDYIYPPHRFFCSSASFAALENLLPYKVVRTKIDPEQAFLTVILQIKPEGLHPMVNTASERDTDDDLAGCLGEIFQMCSSVLHERDNAIKSMTTMIDERDNAIKSMTTMIDERDNAIKSMTEQANRQG